MAAGLMNKVIGIVAITTMSSSLQAKFVVFVEVARDIQNGTNISSLWSWTIFAVFVHISAAQAAGLRLTENMKISFEKEQGNNGKYSAVNLQAAE